MPVFYYKALTIQGQSVEGSYTASSKDEIIAMLHQNMYYPVKIVEKGEEVRELKFSLFNRLKLSDLSIFCRQFYTMLNAGVPIISCLGVLCVQTRNKHLKEVLESAHSEIQRGSTFSDALRHHKRTIPELLINMVEAGEISGNLDIIMERMAVHYEKENKITTKIRNAMIYPSILMGVSILVIIFLLTFVMPTFIGMFQDSGVELPGPTKILLSISGNLSRYWYIHMTSLVVLFAGISQAIHAEKGRLFLDRLKLKIPVVSGMIQKVITTRFCRTLSTLLSSGIPLIQALESVGRVVGNKVVADGIKSSIDEIMKGATLAATMKRIEFFPPMVISMIQIGEESGALDAILEKTANFYDEETESALQKMIALLEPLMIVIMAVVIGFIVIAMILPMFDMLNTVGV
ncbi:type IV pilus assembly protein PilC [Anaerosolibacter carboniphilus]|uniref:Type IV pilus assembly protein PilC n=1 Tax=Anaerosolibacter carboniphilus TaxID=1417629 RepID=A0A841KWH0_9FIRM|nr:type II secretion system F family protein [Anaerosolibacter carboniphilus]MBB6216598.1 type IV pilus assembly protein PilC [Anaerosolibacter carboniphilus]